MSLRLLLVIALVASAGACADPPNAAQKPEKTRLTAVNTQPPPETLSEMLASADAVVIAKATGTTRLRDWGNGLWDTIYSFEVEETLKLSPVIPAAGDVVDIELPGGIKDYPTHIERNVIDGHDVVRPQGRYLIFVRWITNPGYERLVPAWSAAGVYDLTGQRVRSLDTLFTRYNDTEPSTFVANARAAGKQAPPTPETGEQQRKLQQLR